MEGFSGVGGNDQNIDFSVFTMPPEGAEEFGHRIGLALANFNVLEKRSIKISLRWTILAIDEGSNGLFGGEIPICFYMYLIQYTI